jgi:hypothetical protein
MCIIDNIYDSNDTDDKKVLSENCDEINMLTVLTENNHRHERSLKVLDKNKNIMQEHIKKKKQYMILKILYHKNYINILRTVKIQDNQKTLKFEIIFKTDFDALSSESLIKNLKSLSTLRNLFISD